MCYEYRFQVCGFLLIGIRQQAKKACRSYKNESIHIFESEQWQTLFLGKPKYFEIATFFDCSKANIRMNVCSLPKAAVPVLALTQLTKHVRSNLSQHL